MSEAQRLVSLLGDAYTDEGVWIWLTSANRNLGGRTPTDLLINGEGEKVMREAHRLSDRPEVNHGPLTGGGFWAGFCSNPDCNVLGCPGDCQDSPEAQPVAPDAAAVLAGLVAEMREVEASYRVLSSDGHEGMDGLAEAWAGAADMVERQATSGARAVGGAVRVTDGVVALYRPDPVRNPWHCYNTYDGSFIECRTDQDVAGYHVLPAAPPTPSAHGAAALLAECDAVERDSLPEFDDAIPVATIRRLLAPEGADGTEEGT